MSQYTEAIQKLYLAYFRRPADVAGLAFWETTLAQNGGDTSAINQLFSTSTEYRQSYAGMSNAAIVNAVYQNLFGRAAEAGGASYWTSLLDSQQITIANVVSTVANAAQGTDLLVINGKSKLAAAFTANLERLQKANLYAGEDAMGLVYGFFARVVDAGSLAIANSSLLQLVDQLQLLQNSPAQDGLRVNLSTEIDNLVGTAGRDTFNANGFQLIAEDSLDGGANLDQLQISGVGNFPFQVATQATIRNIENISVNHPGNLELDTRNWAGVLHVRADSVGNTSLTAASNTDVQLNNSIVRGMVKLEGGRNQLVRIKDFAELGIISIGDKTPPTSTLDVQVSGVDRFDLGQIWLRGGSIIRVATEEVATITRARGADIDIRGTSQTKAVYLQDLGAQTAGDVFITDVNYSSRTMPGTISTVDVQGLANLVIRDNVLDNLSIAHNQGGTVQIKNLALNSAPRVNLALNLQQSTLALADNGVYETLNVNVSGENQLSSANFAALQTLNLSGSGQLRISGSDVDALSRITVTGSASLSALDLENNLKLVQVDTRNGTGKAQVSIDASRTSYRGGNGIDQLSVTGASIDKTISLGGGDDSLTILSTKAMPNVFLDGGEGVNTLGLRGADAINLSVSNGFANNSRNFQVLQIFEVGTNDKAINLPNLGNFNKVQVLSSSEIVGLQLQNFKTGNTLHLLNSGKGVYTVSNPSFVASSQDSLQIEMGLPAQAPISGNVV